VRGTPAAPPSGQRLALGFVAAEALEPLAAPLAEALPPGVAAWRPG
jgi:hypothetical protein